MSKSDNEPKTVDEYVQILQREFMMMVMLGESPKVQLEYVSSAFRLLLEQLAQAQSILSNHGHILPVKTMYSQIDISDLPGEQKEQLASALENGTLIESNSRIGITVVFRDVKGYTSKRIDDYVYPAPKEDAIQQVMPQIMAIIGRNPTIADVSGDIEGLNAVDIVTICSELSHYRYVGKNEYPEKVLAQFDMYWLQIEAGIKDRGKQYDKLRRKAKKHFKQVIDRTFKNCEVRVEKQGIIFLD